MARQIHRLKAAELAKLPAPARGTRLYGDGGGLALQVSSGGARSWAFRFQLNGKERVLGLGAFDPTEPGKSLADARRRAAEARRLVSEGRDPIEAKRQQRAAAAAAQRKVPTFKEAAEQHIRQHEAAWRNEIHRRQWRSTLEQYAFPHIGHMAVDQITTEDVLHVLRPIWSTLPETASRVRGRIERILAGATALGHRRGPHGVLPNPAVWRGHLNALLPAVSKVARVKPQAAMPFTSVPAFMLRLQQIDSVAARCLAFIILTAVRSSEGRGARWDEIDLAERTWTIGADRMKTRREHRIPLPAPALEILEYQRELRSGSLVFPSPHLNSRPVSDTSLRNLLRQAGYQKADATVHGMRSAFSTWASERTDFGTHIVEMALAHQIENRVEAAYRRGDLFEKRRLLMDAWAVYLGI